MISISRIPPAPRGAGLVVGLALFVPAVATGDADASPQVECADGRVSIRSRGASIARVLEDLALRCGFRIVGREPLVEAQPIAVNGVSLERALKRLLAGHSYVLDTQGRLWVLGNARAGSRAESNIDGGSGHAGDDRQEQIYRLGEDADGVVPDDLRRALHDPDRRVREAAVEAVGEIGGPEAMEAVAVALTDPDLGVRQCAVDALGRIGGDGSLRLLHGLATDAHPLIRAAATDNLEELNGAP